ncbi:unnamed protein product [Clonostachys rosea]|uniref:Uncharacterized protein n=1 Tax=Bionectria ochroleuca TaxID=29856 RepID=A0ABY6UA99_BIOOC|nr:unnamed protein product [Clonostachys rosea]
MADESNFTTLKRRTTEVLQNAQQNLPSINKLPHLPKLPQLPNIQLSQLSSYNPFTKEYPIKGTWERIALPPVPRSSHSLDIIDGSAYLFGGEVEPDKPLDNDVHVIKLAYSSAGADYYSIKAIPAPPNALAEPSPLPAPKTPKNPKAPETEDTKSSDGKKPAEGELDEVSLKESEDTGEEETPGEEEDDEAEEQAQDKSKGKEKVRDEVPPPRVGHASAAIGSRIFVFGGRGGDDMKPLEEAGRVWVFDTRSSQWTYLDPVPAVRGGTIIPHPAARSHHCATSTDRPQDFAKPRASVPDTWQNRIIGDTSKTGIPQDPIVGNVAEEAIDQESDGYGTFFVHGGSLANEDRTNDLWAFDVHSRTWTELPAAPGPTRSGAAICISKSRLFRFGGYDGENEIGGQLDFLQLEVETFDDRASRGEVSIHARGKWQSIYQDQTQESSHAIPNEPVQAWPAPRSAASLHALTIGGGREFLVLAMGEADTDADAGSGKFLSDIWLFQTPPLGMTVASVSDAVLQAVGRKTGEGKWTKVNTAPYDTEESRDQPGPRAWLASAVLPDLEESAIVLWGGLDEDDELLGDGWLLRLGY